MARLRFFFIDYLRRVGTINKSLSFQINELESGQTSQYIDVQESAIRLEKIVTDSLGELKLARKLNFTI